MEVEIQIVTVGHFVWENVKKPEFRIQNSEARTRENQ